MKPRAVVDASTIVSAVLLPDSLPDRALRKALAECELCASTETFAELKAVFARAKFDRYAQPALRQKFIGAYREDCHLFSVASSDRFCRDPTDDKFLALALTAHATVLISNDDLLALHPWRGIPIVTPAAFLASPGSLQRAGEAP